MKILFYAKSPDATEYYRVSVPAKYLERREGVEVKVSYAEGNQLTPQGGVRKNELQWADIVVFQRPVAQGVLSTFSYIKKNHPDLPIVGDYDDDYFSVPRWNPGYPHLKIHEESWKGFFKHFDGVIVSTEPLVEAVSSKVNEHCQIKVIQNGFDSEMFDELDSQDHSFDDIRIFSPDPNSSGDSLSHFYDITPDEFNKLMANKTVCCWAGSRFHYADLEWLADGVKEACEKDPDLVFLFVGYAQQSVLRNIPLNRSFVSHAVAPIPRFYAYLKHLKIDIMIAPLDPCLFNQSKSNLKFMEASYIGAYPVCSEWDPYEGDLNPIEAEKEAVGTLVGYEPGEWGKGLLEASNKVREGRHSSVNNAYCRATHSAELRTAEYVEFFENVIEKKKARKK